MKKQRDNKPQESWEDRFDKFLEKLLNKNDGFGGIKLSEFEFVVNHPDWIYEYELDLKEIKDFISQERTQLLEQVREVVSKAKNSWEHPTPISTDDLGSQVQEVLKDLLSELSKLEKKL